MYKNLLKGLAISKVEVRTKDPGWSHKGIFASKRVKAAKDLIFLACLGQDWVKLRNQDLIRIQR